MKLGATITSERGKPVTKTGNEYLEIKINNGSIHGVYATLTIDAGDGEIELKNSKGVIVYSENAVTFSESKGNLKHGKSEGITCPLCEEWIPYEMKDGIHTWNCVECPFTSQETY